MIFLFSSPAGAGGDWTEDRAEVLFMRLLVWIRVVLRAAWSSWVNSLKSSSPGQDVSGEDEKHIYNANSGVLLKFISVRTIFIQNDTDDLL